MSFASDVARGVRGLSLTESATSPAVSDPAAAVALFAPAEKLSRAAQRYALSRGLLRFRLPEVELEFERHYVEVKLPVYQVLTKVAAAFILLAAFVFDLPHENAVPMVATRLAALFVVWLPITVAMHRSHPFLVRHLETILVLGMVLVTGSIYIQNTIVGELDPVDQFEGDTISTLVVMSCASVSIMRFRFIAAFISATMLLELVLYEAFSTHGVAAWLYVARILVVVATLRVVYVYDLADRTVWVGLQLLEMEQSHLEQEETRSVRVLRNILPDRVANELRAGVSNPVAYHSKVTVVYFDIVGFTPMAARLEARDLVGLLNMLFTAVDKLLNDEVSKIVTVGDAYVAVAGLGLQDADAPDPRASARAALRFAVAVDACIKDLTSSGMLPTIQIRTALAAGPVFGGIIGTQKLAYDVLGPGLDRAIDLEGTGRPGLLHVDRGVLALVANDDDPAVMGGTIRIPAHESAGELLLHCQPDSHDGEAVFLSRDDTEGGVNAVVGSPTSLASRKASMATRQIRRNGGAAAVIEQSKLRGSGMYQRVRVESLDSSQTSTGHADASEAAEAGRAPPPDAFDLMTSFDKRWFVFCDAENEREYRMGLLVKQREHTTQSMAVMIGMWCAFIAIDRMPVEDAGQPEPSDATLDAILLVRVAVAAYLVCGFAAWVVVSRRRWWLASERALLAMIVGLAIGHLGIVAVYPLDIESYIDRAQIQGLVFMVFFTLDAGLPVAASRAVVVAVVAGSTALYLLEMTMDRLIAAFFMLVMCSLIASLGAAQYVRVSHLIYARQRSREAARERLQYERQNTEWLLSSVLPAHVCERLKDRSTADALVADHSEAATLMFVELAGFKQLTTRMPPEEALAVLGVFVQGVDSIVADMGVEKIKTFRNVYFAATAVREEDDPVVGAARMALAALDIQANAAKLAPVDGLSIKIGLCSGPATSGVLGKVRFKYDVFGDAVNTAARFSAYAHPGAINIAQSTADLLDRALVETIPELVGLDLCWAVDKHGVESIKGKGLMEVFALKPRLPRTQGSS